MARIQLKRQARVSNCAITPHSLAHTDTRRISSIRARRLQCTRQRSRGRLMEGMLDGRLILGEGRNKTGTTTSWVGHNTTEQIAGAVAHLRRLALGASMRRGCDVRDGLDAARLKLVSQHSDLGLVAVGCTWHVSSGRGGSSSAGVENALLLHLDLSLLQRVQLLADHLQLLELSGNCVYPLENSSASFATRMLRGLRPTTFSWKGIKRHPRCH